MFPRHIFCVISQCFPCVSQGFLEKISGLVFIKCSFPWSTPQNQQSFATVSFYKPPRWMCWNGVGYGVYKMMMQSTILHNSSIYAVPDHFIKAILASECMLSRVFHILQNFWGFLFSGHVLLVCLEFSQAKKIQEQFSEFPRCFPNLSLVFRVCFPGFPGKNQGFGVYKMQLSMEYTSKPAILCHSFIL